MTSFVPNTKDEIRSMLKDMGLLSVDGLISHIPQSLRAEGMGLAEGMPEGDALSELELSASLNMRYAAIFRGAGAYDHYIPAVVPAMASREELLTAYTPYQAEISQGVLQSIFEYQTDICELLAMDVANASVYDGATAAAEAVMMCRERGKNRAYVSACINPQVLEVINTYCTAAGVPVELIPEKEGRTDAAALSDALLDDAACVYLQQPNFYGLIEDAAGFAELAHGAGARFIMGVHPTAMALYAPPGECGADIAVAEGQPLGLPLSFGGPYLGIMAAKQELVRRLPGRIVGQTVDTEGKRAYVLTLQAREQHIKRERASSSICSNEANCALTASVYLAAMGPQGLLETAESCYINAHRLAEELQRLGYSRVHTGEFWNEFVTVSRGNAAEEMRRLAINGVLGGLPLSEDGILWCATEKNSDLSLLISLLSEVDA